MSFEGSIGLLGLGSIGKRHARNIRALEPKARLVAWDPCAESLASFASELEIEIVAHEDDFWSHPKDCYFICSPPSKHTEQLIRATAQGVPVFVEKPLSNTLDQLDRIPPQAQVMVGCNMRFHPGVAKVKEWLASGQLGKAMFGRFYTGSYLPAWRPHSDYRQSYTASPLEGGALLDCIHEIDLALWFLGSAALQGCIKKKAHSIGLEVEGMAELLLEHETESISSVHLNFIQRDYQRHIHIVGSSGSAYWDWNKKSALLYNDQGALVETFLLTEAWESNHMYLDEIRTFFKCLEESQVPMGNVHEAKAALSIALEARHHV